MKIKLTFLISALLIMGAQAHAAQIAPNPNPAGNTITVSGSDSNGTAFNNNGTINVTNTGTLTNNSSRTLNNNAGGAINNSGTLINNYRLYNNTGSTFITNAGGIFTNSSTFTNYSGAAFTLNGTCNNTGTFTNNGAFYNTGTIANAGTATFAAGSTYDFTGSTFNNNSGGTLTLNRNFTLNGTDGGTVNLNAGGTLKNYATLTNEAGHTQVNNGTITNYSGGAIINSSGATLTNNTGAAITVNSGSTLTSNGALNNAGTIANSGTVTLAAGSAYDFTGGTFNNSKTLILNRDFTFGEAIAGTINLNSAGTLQNNAILTNAAGHTQANAGALSINSGSAFRNYGTMNNNGTVTLAAGSSYDFTGGTFNNNNGGTLVLNRDFTFNGADSGTMNLNSGGRLQNFATLTIAAGQTLVNNGYVDNGTSSNNSSSQLVNNGTIELVGGLWWNDGRFYNSATGTINIGITSTSRMSCSGSFYNDGTINVGADGQFIVEGFSGGTLDNTGQITVVSGSAISLGTLNNSGRIDVYGFGIAEWSAHQNNTGTLQNHPGGEMQLAGAFDNRGFFINDTGASTLFDGEFTNMAGGILRNNGTITGDVNGVLYNNAGATFINNGNFETVNTFTNDGLFKGNGTTTGNVVNNGAIAPGNSIGTINIVGNYTHNAGATYEVEVNAAGQSDKINITGTATRNGGTVSALAETGNYNLRTTYTILTAAGGVTGTFANLTSNLAFLTPLLSYDPQNVYLTLTRNSTGFSQIGGLTENELNVASSLDSISLATPTGDMEGIINALLSLDAAGARNAYDQMGGLIHTTIGEVTFSTIGRYINTMNTRMGSFLTGGPAWNYSVQPLNLASLASRDTVTDAGNKILAALGNNGMDKAPVWGLWAQGYGSLAERNDVDISSRYKYDTGGIVLGLDKQLYEPLLLGVSLGYSYNHVKLTDLSESAQGRGLQMSGYGMYNKPDWYFSAILGYSFIHYDTARNMSLGGLARTADADYNTHAFGAYLEGGYKLITQNVDLIPMFSLTSGYMLRDSFTEVNAGALNLDADNAYSSYLRGSLGVKFRKDLTGSWGTTTPELTVRWDHRLTNDRLALNANFSGYPNAPFTVKGDLPDTDSLGVGLGLTWKTKDNVDLSINYDGSFSGNNMLNAVTLNLRCLW